LERSDSVLSNVRALAFIAKKKMHLPVDWKARARRLVPTPVLNGAFLRFPRLYETRLVAYESHLSEGGRIELLAQLDLVSELEGDIVECGSAHCGTSIVMARHAVSRGMNKVVFACDTYQGFDPTELAQERAKGLTVDGVPATAFTSTSIHYVRSKIAALRLERTVIPVKGLFQETLPGLPGPFALAFVDCDLRDSLLFAGTTIWPKLSPGGRVVFDDYTNAASKGARDGVELFVKAFETEIEDHGLLGRLYYAVKARGSKLAVQAGRQTSAQLT